MIGHQMCVEFIFWKSTYLYMYILLPKRTVYNFLVRRLNDDAVARDDWVRVHK